MKIQLFDETQFEKELEHLKQRNKILREEIEKEMVKNGHKKLKRA